MELLSTCPLLAPFSIYRPYSSSQSALLRIIGDEVNYADNVKFFQQYEDKLRTELQKAEKEAPSNKDGNNYGDKKKRKQNKSLSLNYLSTIKSKEEALQQISYNLQLSQMELQHHSNFMRSALQCEYSKLVVTLNLDSQQYHDLERSMDYLFNDHDRIEYFSEMLEVLKKIDLRKEKLRGIETFPLIEQFQYEANSSLIKGFIEELWSYLILEEVRTRYDGSIGLSQGKSRLVKYASETMERASTYVSDLIKKHYRKKSVKLHPDRKGEEFRPIFERFKHAKDVLLNGELRTRYLREMINVILYYPQGNMMDQAHELWMTQHANKIAEGESLMKKEDIKRIEGGWQRQCLSAPLVKIDSRDENCRVEVTIRVPKPMHEFYSRVRSITVSFESTHGISFNITVPRVVIVKPLQIKKKEEFSLPSQIYIGETILDEGYWDIRWVAALDSAGCSPKHPNSATDEIINTNESYAFSMVVINKVKARNLEHFVYVEQQCKVVKGHLSNVLNKFNSQNGSNRFECHETLIRAAKMHRNFKVVMELAGKTSSAVYDELGTLLDSSHGTIEQLEAVNARQEKKNSARNFKSYMASMLQSEYPLTWMKNVKVCDLEYAGGDVNRLYQFFIEGKGKCIRFIDSEVLKEASLRTDLFSHKQCKELILRSKEAARQWAKEEEESHTARERRISEEEERNRLMCHGEMCKSIDMVSSVIVTEITMYVVMGVTKKLTGKKGRSKRALEKQSGAKLHIQSNQAANGYVPVVLTGDSQRIMKAVKLVRDAVGSENVYDSLVSTKCQSGTSIGKRSRELLQHTEFNGIQPKVFSPVKDDTPVEIPSQFPSEIGFMCNNQCQPTTDGSVSTLNNRSHSSRTLFQQDFILPDNDPLLVFLRTQQSCIKGCVDEFFIWLVRSEDVDTIAALKEAVEDEEYLSETMKIGNGMVGLKGFKRKAFQRAVVKYQETKVTDSTASTKSLSGFVATDASLLCGIGNNAFLPSFLYSDFEDALNMTTPKQSKRDITVDYTTDEAVPPEFICPITHELMTEDPVVAADGVTYERSAIENWFHNQVAQVKMAQEQLQTNPHLRREQELVSNGVCSPLYGTSMKNLYLTPNTSIRTLARAHKDRTVIRLGLDGSISPSPSNVSMFRFAN